MEKEDISQFRHKLKTKHKQKYDILTLFRIKHGRIAVQRLVYTGGVR